MNQPGLERPSLFSQITLAFVSLVLLTAIIAGLPALWLIREQQQRQAWSQVKQGSQAVRALYTARQNEVVGLATLMTERPTLQALLPQARPASLASYLDNLRTGTNVDAMLICDSRGVLLAQVGADLPATVCEAGKKAGYYVVPGSPTPHVWLLAAQPVASAGVPQGLAIVGERMDREFAVEISDQTGLQHTLFLLDAQIASSLQDEATDAKPLREIAPGGDMERVTFTANAKPYYAEQIALTDLLPRFDTMPSDLAIPQVEVALAVTDLIRTQQRLAGALIISVLGAIVVGLVLGAFLARRINRPLARLADAAAALSHGTLDTSLASEARVREVALVARALENAGRDLQRTLADLQREKGWTDHLLAAIVEGIMTLDRQGRIVFFSAGAERITGWRREAVIGQPCDHIFKAVETEEPFSRILPTPGHRQKITLLIAPDRMVTLDMTSATLLPSAADQARLALVFRDVSQEESVHRLIGHFLANITHEFRTPLSAAAASVELLRDQAPDLSLSELQELLTSLHLGIVGLQNLVDNLLEGASIEVGRFRVYPRPCDPARIITEVVQTMQPLLDKRGQRIITEMPPLPQVHADMRRSQQALINLLSNASKYGLDGAEISVSATVAESHVRVAVSDQGPGVSPELWQDLFRRFRRIDSGNGDAQYGVGLGLSVVKAIVEAQGGAVGVENRADDGEGGPAGAIFWFTLPIAMSGGQDKP
ncbi:MAG: HAMP domain-containing protein [Caldilineales bacterium]|nr:HAMP domain-containing protein [Caldilineales bacterium]